ncbi:hypothetical protein G9A89_004884 [Geosiphon pyriformis]|nr:hypothetical protein G9A89_004884 [Geosiphon pyriformis]
MPRILKESSEKRNDQRSSEDKFNLDALLKGKTCEPVSLKQFHAYCQYKEYSIENLEFYQWFQGYKLKFQKLPKDQQEISPTATSLSQCSNLTGESLPLYSGQLTQSFPVTIKNNHHDINPSFHNIVAIDSNKNSTWSLPSSNINHNHSNFNNNPNPPIIYLSTSESCTISSPNSRPISAYSTASAYSECGQVSPFKIEFEDVNKENSKRDSIDSYDSSLPLIGVETSGNTTIPAINKKGIKNTSSFSDIILSSASSSYHRKDSYPQSIQQISSRDSIKLKIPPPPPASRLMKKQSSVSISVDDNDYNDDDEITITSSEIMMPSQDAARRTLLSITKPSSPLLSEFGSKDLALNPIPTHPQNISVSIYVPNQSRFLLKSTKINPAPMKFNLVTPHTSIQPFRHEIATIIKKYLIADAEKEINIPSTMRKSVIAYATQTTHWSIFEPVVQHVYNIMKTSSLKGFLKEAVQNVDDHAKWEMARKAALFGVLCIATVVIIEVFGGVKWWRFFCFPLLFLTITNLIAYKNKFCVQRYQRNERVLKQYEITVIENDLVSTNYETPLLTELLSARMREAKNLAGKVMDPIIEDLQRKLLWKWIVGFGTILTIILQIGILWLPEGWIRKL